MDSGLSTVDRSHFLYQELFEIGKLEHAFVISFAEDHGKYAHVVETFDVVKPAYATAGQHTYFGKSVDDLLVKIESRAFKHTIARYISGLNVFEAT